MRLAKPVLRGRWWRRRRREVYEMMVFVDGMTGGAWAVALERLLLM